MRSTFHYLAAVAVLLSACAGVGNKEHAPAEQITPAAEAADSTTFSNNLTPLTSPSRKRVRTADVRCRVENVFNAASKMEHVVAGLNGIIVESTMQQDVGEMQEVPYAGDSLKRIRLYTPTADLTLRVPVQSLDSVVQTLTSMAAFIEYRNLKEEDKTLAYLSNSLRNQLPQNLPIKPDSAIDAIRADQYLINKQEEKINRQIANLSILDEANYATLSIQLTQPQQADVQVIVNPEYFIRAGFGTDLLLSLQGGLDACRSVLLFFIRLWPFLLFAIAGWWAYRKFVA